MAHMVDTHPIAEERQRISRSFHPVRLSTAERTDNHLGFSDGNIWGPVSERECGELYSNSTPVTALGASIVDARYLATE